MARYSIEISRSAEKQLASVPVDAQRRLARAMMALADEPRPSGSRKLSGHNDIFRIRVGTYRVLYSVADGLLVVIILKIGHRKDIYR